MGAKTIVDELGRIMFHCRDCAAPMTEDDFFGLGLRIPDAGEPLEDYCDAELIDDFRHAACPRAAKTG